MSDVDDPIEAACVCAPALALDECFCAWGGTGSHIPRAYPSTQQTPWCLSSMLHSLVLNGALCLLACWQAYLRKTRVKERELQDKALDRELSNMQPWYVATPPKPAPPRESPTQCAATACSSPLPPSPLLPPSRTCPGLPATAHCSAAMRVPPARRVAPPPATPSTCIGL